jgi:hypothetical protein
MAFKGEKKTSQTSFVKSKRPRAANVWAHTLEASEDMTAIVASYTKLTHAK